MQATSRQQPYEGSYEECSNIQRGWIIYSKFLEFNKKLMSKDMHEIHPY